MCFISLHFLLLLALPSSPLLILLLSLCFVAKTASAGAVTASAISALFLPQLSSSHRVNCSFGGLVIRLIIHAIVRALAHALSCIGAQVVVRLLMLPVLWRSNRRSEIGCASEATALPSPDWRTTSRTGGLWSGRHAATQSSWDRLHNAAPFLIAEMLIKHVKFENATAAVGLRGVATVFSPLLSSTSFQVTNHSASCLPVFLPLHSSPNSR
ncbi:hypothetical protein TcWFU_010166 [Taenia crassiceps]|uniref:Secreted protein n=1 Tax=Taenia crassiceps TaxID=6207 RepID=A0ABR4QC70_9CEST